MAGLRALPQSVPIGKAIDDIALIAQAVDENEIDGQIVFLPLQ